MHAEIRMARIVEAVGLYKTGKVTCEQAAEWLGVSERHFRRLRDRYEAEGAEGIIDRRRGRASGRRGRGMRFTRIPVAVILRARRRIRGSNTWTLSRRRWGVCWFLCRGRRRGSCRICKSRHEQNESRPFRARLSRTGFASDSRARKGRIWCAVLGAHLPNRPSPCPLPRVRGRGF